MMLRFAAMLTLLVSTLALFSTESFAHANVTVEFAECRTSRLLVRATLTPKHIYLDLGQGENEYFLIQKEQDACYQITITPSR